MQTDPAISRLLTLRSAAIAVQFFAVVSVYFLFDYQVAIFPLLAVIIVEALFQLLSILAYRKVNHAKPIAVLMQLTADILFLSILLSLSGGATNAFVSLLLLPIMIAAVSVNGKGLAYIAGLAIAAYSYLLFKMPDHSMHQIDMTHHFIGMWVNFVISVIVIAFIIGALNRTIKARDATIARGREQQLRHEQLLTLDGAAAQITHQLASPIANLQFLYEELKEQQADDPIIQEMAKPLEQCNEQLAHFRALSSALRTGKTQTIIPVDVLQKEIADAALLHHPEHTLEWLNEPPNCTILSDAMLLPAILNLLQNAVLANNQQHSHIEARWQFNADSVSLSLRDFGQGLSEQQMAALGGQLMPSQHGMGMAVMLSNVTLERLEGSLTVSNHKEQGAVATITLKVA
jgi:two-component system sensor histidine kinase RegB